MALNLNTADVTNANILLNAVNAPLINKNKPFYELFKIYYYNKVTTFEKEVKFADGTIDQDSQTLAILYNQFTNVHMQCTETSSSALQCAILRKTNNPLDTENI